MSLLSVDTNILVHASNSASPQHEQARAYVAELARRRDVVICELMLVELYLKLRSERIFPKPLTAEQASTVCTAYRNNRAWRLVDAAPVMDEVWRFAATPGFAFRRIVDVRLGLTLRHAGVTDFATANVRDFRDLGFVRVFDPLVQA
ncbi:MAG: PIN domain-containing protein [Myxococcales bacterium]|nr:PIN domain-containing protein [Myxococcales bacterium]